MGPKISEAGALSPPPPRSSDVNWTIYTLGARERERSSFCSALFQWPQVYPPEQSGGEPLFGRRFGLDAD